MVYWFRFFSDMIKAAEVQVVTTVITRDNHSRVVVMLIYTQVANKVYLSLEEVKQSRLIQYMLLSET
jgi:hypothetical protein